ncbi:hypothetical protein [Mitsuokella multacida]|uniref:hypothetical protein n=1 Tax=Mitsuokella multacida TaxID=52226 RepID=UPI003F5FDFC2
MPKYKVYFKIDMHGDAFVRADSLEEAKDLAKNLNARDLVERAFYEDAAYTDRIYKEIGTEVIESRTGTKRM